MWWISKSGTTLAGAGIKPTKVVLFMMSAASCEQKNWRPEAQRSPRNKNKLEVFNKFVAILLVQGKPQECSIPMSQERSQHTQTGTIIEIK
jgi:hypothetical protein